MEEVNTLDTFPLNTEVFLSLWVYFFLPITCWSRDTGLIKLVQSTLLAGRGLQPLVFTAS